MLCESHSADFSSVSNQKSHSLQDGHLPLLCYGLRESKLLPAPSGSCSVKERGAWDCSLQGCQTLCWQLNCVFKTWFSRSLYSLVVPNTASYCGFNGTQKTSALLETILNLLTLNTLKIFFPCTNYSRCQASILVSGIAEKLPKAVLHWTGLYMK